MKTDDLLKEMKARKLRFKNESDAKLLNKNKNYHFHDTYKVPIVGSSNTKFMDIHYAYPCLVEIENEKSTFFQLERIGQIDYEEANRMFKAAYERVKHLPVAEKTTEKTEKLEEEQKLN